MSKRRPRLLLVSVDGLQPTAYLRESPESHPYFVELASRGAFAREARPVYPSVTFTVHATLATGVHPDRHGIFSNTRFDPKRVSEWKEGESQDWNFEASLLESPPLWELAHREGLETALLRWPTTVGAGATWLIPELFPIGRYDTGLSLWKTLARHSTPALVEVIERSARFREPEEHRELDETMLLACFHLLQETGTELLMAHFTQYDHAIHEEGTQAPVVRQALTGSAETVRRLLGAVDLSVDHVLIFGDHGFLDFRHRVHPNALFQEKGWISTDGARIRDWQVIALTDCGQAPVYLKDPAIGPEVWELLNSRSRGAYRLLSAEELKKLRTQPDAFCALDCLPGYSMGQNLSGELITPLKGVRGDHGYLPEHHRIQAGFIALGPGVPEGGDLGRIELLDVAPTAARLLGLSLPRAEGRDLLG